MQASSSNLDHAKSRDQQWGVLLLVLITSSLLFGCVAPYSPTDFSTGVAVQTDREQQTRRFEGGTEAELLNTSVNVLQDLGFTVTASQETLGFITAVKDRDAKAPGQKASVIIILMILSAAGGQPPPGALGNMPEKQHISVLVTIRPAPGKEEGVHLVRATFYRSVFQPLSWEGGQLREPELYEAFFDLLSKAIFLEAHKL